MPQSLAKNLIHLVFSTRNREQLVTEAVRERLCAYAAGVLRDLDSPAIATNAWRGHVHVLFSLSKNQALSHVVMEVNGPRRNGSRLTVLNSRIFIGKGDMAHSRSGNRE